MVAAEEEDEEEEYYWQSIGRSCWTGEEEQRGGRASILMDPARSIYVPGTADAA
jgi:hypothetical protein